MTNKRGPYIKGNKTWQTCLNKLQEFKNTNVNYWTEYHLLGYWINLSNMNFNHESVSPSRHSQLIKMRLIIAKLHGLNKKTTRFDSSKVKRFLDWSWAEIKNRKIVCTSLSLLIGDRSKFVDNFLNQKTKYYSKLKIDRTEKLPAIAVDILAQNNLKAISFGELAAYANIPEVIVPWKQLEDFGITKFQIEKVI